MKVFYKKIFSLILLVIVLLLFLRIDYRFKNNIECCSDEYDYFMHATTIVEDFDFDYSNQDLRDFKFTNGSKSAPVGFVGTGILTSPFLYVGKFLNQIFNENVEENLFNFQIFMYSMSSVFYFFLSYIYLYKMMKLLGSSINKYHLLLFFSSSGLTYYAFERFGMTHVFEVFTITILIYLLVKNYTTSEDKLTKILIPPFMFLSFLVRMSNFYIFLIPFIISKILNKRFNIKHSLIRDRYFIISFLTSLIFYINLVTSIYGKFILNPQQIYGDTKTTQDYFGTINSLPETIFEMFNSSLNILFTFEFGIFWMSPILFFGTIMTLFLLKDYKQIVNWVIFICFAQNFAIVYIWQSAASSYGFRYLLTLLPLSMFLLFTFDFYEKIRVYLIMFSLFSLLGIMFFETTQLTQLSLTDQLNSFGRSIRYVQPEYVKGVVTSILSFESYLIIFTTSFLGATIFKVLLTVFGRNSLIQTLSNFGLPVENSDFQLYLNNLSEINLNKFILILIIFILFSYKVVYKLDE